MIGIFYESIHHIDCEECKVMFPLGKGGVCARCRRILCNAHLHESRWQRMRVNLFGAEAVCPGCRRERVGTSDRMSS